MPTPSSGTLSNRLSIEPRRALLTPSASPSVAPPDRPLAKRPRLRSTPSSCTSATPSTSNDSTSSADVDSARRASTLRVLNVWAQLAERYNKRLDEDDIIDLHSCAIIKDRGVFKNTPREYLFGHFAESDGDQDSPDGEQDQEDSEQDDDDEQNAHPPSEATTDDDAPISKKELLRGVPPLSVTTDAEDLREFLEAEKKRKVLAGDEDEEDLSPAQLSAIREALEEQSPEEEDAAVGQARDATNTNYSPEGEVDVTPRQRSARVQPSDDGSDDELGVWVHDESTALYPVARIEPEQGVHKVGQEVIELTDSDSDREFEALLIRPPRFSQPPPSPVLHPKGVQQPPQSPPDSERGRAKTRSKPKIKPKAEVTPKSENRLRSPLVPKKKPSASKETSSVAVDNGERDQAHISPACKGKGKEIQTPPDGSYRKTPKSLGSAPRGRKRKRIVSSTTSSLLSQPPDQKHSPQSRGKSSSTLPQPNDPEPTLDYDVSTPARSERPIPGHLRSFSSGPNTQRPTLSAPAYRSPEIQSSPHNYHSHRSLPRETPIIATHPYSQRPSSVLLSPDQRAPGPSLPARPLPPIDPVQAQQAHYLLAQAMQQLTYLLSATMPPYATYTPSPGQPWRHPPPPPPPPPLSHAAYSTPIHHSSHFHGTRPYHTPSSSLSRSALPPSSPVPSLVSPVEERRSLGRGRSKSRGRRVSFKESEEVVGGREHSVPLEPHSSGPKKREQIFEERRESRKERVADVFDDAFREDRGSPPREVVRGRTPGPPSRQKNEVPRGRSLGRR